jgi:hypothetical protein
MKELMVAELKKLQQYWQKYVTAEGNNFKGGA